MKNPALDRLPILMARMRSPRGNGWWLLKALSGIASLSAEALMIKRRDNRLPEREIRAELVARVRRQIEQGTYDTPEKLELALLRWLSQIDGDDDPPPRRTRR